MRGPVQTQLVRATWPQDQGRILSPVVPRRDVGLRRRSIHPAGRKKQGTSRIHESGVCRVPGAPLWSSGSLCSLAAVTPQGPQRCTMFPALQVHQCLRTVLVGCWWLLAERRQQIPGATGPASLPFACRGTAGRQRAAPQSPLLSCPAQAELSRQRPPRGPLLFESDRAGSAAPPVPKGLTGNFLC